MRSATLIPCMLLALSSAACECEPEEATEAEPEAEPSPPRPYEVHEWGLISFGISEDRGLATAGPGRFPLALRAFSMGGGSGSAYKPVLYVHLGEGVDETTFSAAVRVPAGVLPEHWPDGETGEAEGGATVRWPEVTALRGACTELTYPSVGDPRCRDLDDGFCEVAELPLYETDDGACLQVGEARHNNLFYRAGFPARSPIEVTREGILVRVRHTGEHALSGKVIRVMRGATPELTRAVLLDPPAPGETIEIAAPDEAVQPEGAPTAAHDAVLASIDETLAELGLTEAERAAFRRAWEDDLVSSEGAGAAARMANAIQRPRWNPPPLGFARDAVFYWMPAEDLEEILPLAFEPAPTAVRRAILVRVHVEPAPWPVANMRDGASRLGETRPPRGGEQIPRMVPTEVEVEDERLPPVVIRRFVRRNLRELRACYVTALEERPALAGQITIAATITETGALRDVRVAESSVEDPMLERCFVNRWRGFTFPPSRELGPVALRYGFELAPGDGAPTDMFMDMDMETNVDVPDNPDNPHAPPGADAPAPGAPPLGPAQGPSPHAPTKAPPSPAP